MPIQPILILCTYISGKNNTKSIYCCIARLWRSSKIQRWTVNLKCYQLINIIIREMAANSILVTLKSGTGAKYGLNPKLICGNVKIVIYFPATLYMGSLQQGVSPVNILDRLRHASSCSWRTVCGILPVSVGMWASVLGISLASALWGSANLHRCSSSSRDCQMVQTVGEGGIAVDWAAM